MFTKKFWIDAAERCIKTMAQILLTLGALDPASVDFSTSIQTKLVGAAMAGVVSILTSIVSSGFGQRDSASAIDVKEDDGAFTTELGVLCFLSFVVGLIVSKVFLC